MATPDELAVDHLPAAAGSLTVQFVDGADFGTAAERGPRPPHRHDYHELMWIRCGSGSHRVDGEPVDITASTISVIARGRVHVLERGEDLHGAVIRFGDEWLSSDRTARANPAWLLGLRSTSVVAVPPGATERLEGVIGALADELRRPPDRSSADLRRHLLSVLLLWIERWFEDAQAGFRGIGDDALQLYRRFVEELERDYATDDDAGHYADVLGVPQAALSKALSEVTGRTTKQLIVDRRMTEAARLLHFTTLTVGEIAHRAGYGDQLYFSRAFRRRFGTPPSAYRQA